MMASFGRHRQRSTSKRTGSCMKLTELVEQHGTNIKVARRLWIDDEDYHSEDDDGDPVIPWIFILGLNRSGETYIGYDEDDLPCSWNFDDDKDDFLADDWEIYVG